MMADYTHTGSTAAPCNKCRRRVHSFVQSVGKYNEVVNNGNPPEAQWVDALVFISVCALWTPVFYVYKYAYNTHPSFRLCMYTQTKRTNGNKKKKKITNRRSISMFYRPLWLLFQLLLLLLLLLSRDVINIHGYPPFLASCSPKNGFETFL